MAAGHAGEANCPDCRNFSKKFETNLQNLYTNGYLPHEDESSDHHRVRKRMILLTNYMCLFRQLRLKHHRLAKLSIPFYQEYQQYRTSVWDLLNNTQLKRIGRKKSQNPRVLQTQLLRYNLFTAEQQPLPQIMILGNELLKYSRHLSRCQINFKSTIIEGSRSKFWSLSHLIDGLLEIVNYVLRHSILILGDPFSRHHIM